MAFEYKRNRNKVTSETNSPKFTYTRDLEKRKAYQAQKSALEEQKKREEQNRLANFQSNNKAMDFFLADKRPELKTAGANEVNRLAKEYADFLEKESYFLNMDIPAQKKVLEDRENTLKQLEDLQSQYANTDTLKKRVESDIKYKESAGWDTSHDKSLLDEYNVTLEDIRKQMDSIGSVRLTWDEVNKLKGDIKYAEFKQGGKKLTDFALSAEDFETSNAYGKDGLFRDDAVEQFLDAFPDLNTNYRWEDNEFFTAMNEQEKKILGYYLGHKEYGLAAQYVNYLRETVGNKIAEQHRKDADTWYEKLGYAFMAGGDMFRQNIQGVGRAIVGNDGYTPPSPIQQGSSMIRQDIEDAEGFGNRLLGGAYDVTSTTVNMLPSIALSIASPTAGAVLMGTTAGGNAYTQMINEGGTWGQAVCYGVLVGTSEAVLERALGGIVGKEKIVGVLMPKLKKAASKVALKIGEDIISEFSEEALQTVLEPLFASWVTNTDYEAPEFEDVMYSGLLGAITGGMFTGANVGGKSIANTVIERVQNAQIQSDLGETILNFDTANEDIKKLIDNAQQSGDKKLQKAANKVAKTEKDGTYDVSARKVGRLAQMSKEQLAQSLMDTATGNDLKSQTIEKLTKSGMNQKGAERAFDLIARDASRGSESKELQSLINKNPDIRTMYDNMVEYLSDEAVTKRVEDVAKASPVTEISNRIVDQRLKDAGIEVVDESGDIDNIDSVVNVDEFGNYILKRKSGETVTYDPSSYNLPNVDASNADKVSFATELFGLNGAQTYVKLAPDNASVEYKSAFHDIYNQGNTNKAFTQIDADISLEAQKAIYEAGKADFEAAKQRKIDAEKKAEAAEKAAKEKEASFVKKEMGFKSDRVTVSDAALEKLKAAKKDGKGEQYKAAVKVIENLAKILQVNINIVASETDSLGQYIGANGQYNRATNTFTFDITSGMDNVAEISYTAMVKTAGHELTHFIQNWSPSKYLTLKNTTLKFLTEEHSEQWINKQLKDIQKNNKAIGKNLTLEQAKDELVADAFEDVLSNIDFAETILRTDKTLFDKIHSWVKKNVSDFKKNLGIAVKDVEAQTEAGKTMKEAGERAQALYDQWADAFSTALENSTSGQTDVDADVQNRARTTNLAEMREEYYKVSKEAREAKKQLDLLGEYPRMNEFFAAMDSKDAKLLDEMTADYNRWQDESGYNAANEKAFTLGKKASDLYGNIQRLEEELSRELRERKYTEEEIAKYVQKAVRKYHTTTQLSKASYLLTTGSLLDFSEGQRYRVQDHREIAEVLDLPDYAQYADGMIVFMNMGNIRLQTYGIDISAMPNSKQLSALRSIIPSVMREYDEFTVDFSKPNGNSDGSVTYPEGVATARILSDIKSYFDTGVVPEYDDSLSQFYQARNVNGKKVAWIKENILLEKGEQSVHTFIEEYIKNHVGEYYTIFESGQKVYLGEDLPYEYVHSKYSQKLNANKSKTKAKNRAAADLGAMIEIATNRKWEKTKNTETKDAKYGFYKYDTNFAFPVYVGEKLTSVKAYSASLLIRNASDGKKYLYDVINIKKDDAIAVELFEKESRSRKRVQLTSSKDTIPQETSSVKENISDTQNSARRRNKNYLDVESRFGVAESVSKYAETVSDPALKAKLKANATTYAKKLDEYETESIRYDNATANRWDEMAATAYYAMTMAKTVINQIETDADFALSLETAVGAFENYSEETRKQYQEKYKKAIAESKDKVAYIRNEMRAMQRDISDSERKAKEFAQREKKANYRAKQIELRNQRDRYMSFLSKEKTRIKTALEKPSETASVPKDTQEIAKKLIGVIDSFNKFNNSSALTKSSAELIEKIVSIANAEMEAGRSKSLVQKTNATDKVLLGLKLSFDQVRSSLDALVAEYEKLSPEYTRKDGEKAPSAAAAIVYDEQLHNALKELAKDFSAPELVFEHGLSYVYEGIKVIRAMNHQLLKANQMYVKGKSVEVLKLRNMLLQDVKMASPFLNKFLGNALVSNVLMPKTMLHIVFGATENADIFYDMLDDGQMRYIRFMNGAREIFDPVAKEIENEKFKSDKPTLKTGLKYMDGTDVLLNYEFALSFIKIVENEDSLRHAVWGGLQIPDLVPYNKGDKSAYNSKRLVEHAQPEYAPDAMTDEQIAKTLEKASEEGRTITDQEYLDMYAQQIVWNNRQNLAKEIEAKYKAAALMLKEQMSKTETGKKALTMLSLMTRYYDQYARKYLNEATMELYGFEKTLQEGKTYYPIRVRKDEKASDDNVDIVRDFSLENWGSMKHRVDSKKGIELYGALTELESYMENTAKYYAWTTVTKNMKKILNTQIIDDNGTVTTLVGKVNQLYGSYDPEAKGVKKVKNKFMSGFEKYMKDLQTEIIGANKGGEKWAKLQGAFVTNALLMNISTPLVQYSATPLVAVDSGYLSFIKTVAKGGKIPALLSEAQKQYVAKYSEVYRYRSSGLINVDLAAAKQNKGVVSKALSSKALAWTESADAQVLGKQFYALLDHVKRTHKGISAEEAARIAGKQLDQTIYEFQANYTVLQRAPVLRGSGIKKLLFGTFRTQQITLLNAMIDSSVRSHTLSEQMKQVKKDSPEYKALERKRSDSKKRTAKIHLAIALSNALNAFIRMGVGFIRRKDDDEKGETAFIDFLDSYLSMIPLFGDIASAIVSIASGRMFYGEKVFSLGMLDTLSDSVTSAAEIAGMLFDDEDQELSEYIKELTNVLAVSGVPARNIYNIIKMIMGWAEDAADAAGWDWDLDVDEW